MELSLSLPAIYILHQLQKHGYEAYIVGGAVRDLLVQTLKTEWSVSRSVTDYDFTTNARPEQILAVFPEAFYENTFGTVSITHEDVLNALHLTQLPEENTGNFLENTILENQRSKIIDPANATKIHESLRLPSTSSTPAPHLPDYQITTYRADETYDDFRRPTAMNWGNSLQQDLERRDFTINAMALSVPIEQLEKLVAQNHDALTVKIDEVSLIDPFAGQSDLQAGMIRNVGDTEQRFKEDALRMLRAVRFAVQLNMQIEEQTFEAILKNADLLQYISAERIRDEFLKMLSSSYPAEAVQLLDQTGLLQYILPELLAAKGVEQGGHHTTDVWTHSVEALRYCPSSDPIVRLATLIHDIAKPQTQRFTPQTITFYNHEIVGSRMAQQIAVRLKLSRKEIDRIFKLVRYHMFYYQPHNTDAAIRRFMRQVGLENIDDILALREGDRLGSGARDTSWRLEEMKLRMQQQLHQPFAITDLAINGDDLMTELGLKPGPQIGIILRQLFEEVLEKPELNQRETLLEMAKKTSE